MNLVSQSYKYISKDKNGIVTLEFDIDAMPDSRWVVEFNSLYADMHISDKSTSIYRYVYFTLYNNLEASISEKSAFIDEVSQRIDKVNKEISDINSAIIQNLAEGNVLVFDNMDATQIADYYVKQKQLKNEQFFRLNEPYKTILEEAGY